MGIGGRFGGRRVGPGQMTGGGPQGPGSSLGPGGGNISFPWAGGEFSPAQTGEGGSSSLGPLPAGGDAQNAQAAQTAALQGIQSRMAGGPPPPSGGAGLGSLVQGGGGGSPYAGIPGVGLPPGAGGTPPSNFGPPQGGGGGSYLGPGPGGPPPVPGGGMPPGGPARARPGMGGPGGQMPWWQRMRGGIGAPMTQ